MFRVAHHLGAGCSASEPPSWVWRNAHHVGPDEPRSSLQKAKTQTRVLRTPTVLPACEMISSRTQVWMRNRDRQKFLQFHFITRVVASGILSARWLWMELRVQRSRDQQPARAAADHALGMTCLCFGPSASPSVHSESYLLTIYSFFISRLRLISVVSN